MATKVTKEKIIEPGIFDDFIKNAEEADAVVTKWEKDTKKRFTAIKKAAQGISFGESIAEDIEKIDKATQDLAKNQKKLSDGQKARQKITEKNAKENEKAIKKQQKEEEKAAKTAFKNSKEGIKQSILQRKETKKNREEVEKEILLEEQFGTEIKDNTQLLANLDKIENKLITTRDQAEASTKALRKAVKGLSVDKSDEADAIRRLNAVIDKNTEFQNENSDARTQAANNTGNYTESINEAIEGTGAFDEVLSKVDGTTSAMIGSISQFITGMRDQAQATEAAGKAADKTGGRFRKLNNVLKAGLITAVVAALAAMVAAFTQSRAGARELAIITEQLSNSILLLGKRLIIVAKAYGQFLVSLVKISPFALIFKSVGRLRKEIKLLFLELTTFEIPPKFVAGVKVFDGISFGAKDSKEKITELKKELEEPFEFGFGDALDNFKNTIDVTKEAFKDFDDIFVSTNSRVRELLELQDRLIDQNAIRERQIAIITGQEEKLQEIADDDTRSFEEMEKAQRALIVTQMLRIKIQKEIAEAELKVATKAIQNDLERAGVLGQVTEAQIKNLSFLKDANLADEVSIENLERLKTATIELITLENEQQTNALAAGGLLNRILRDQFEQRLDFAVDAFDNQRAINERLLGDAKIDFQERVKLLVETQRLEQKAFNNQVKLAEDFAKNSISERLKIAKVQDNIDEEEIARLENQLKSAERLDIRKLSTLKDEEDIRTNLIELGLVDEIVTLRILEIIRERKTATQDLIEVQRDLFEEAKQSESDLQTFRRDLAVTLAEEETERRTKDLEEAKFFSFLKLDAAKEAIELEKEAKLSVIELEEDLLLQTASNESEKTRIIEEANEKRRQIEMDTAEQNLELQKKSIDQLKGLTGEAIDFLVEIDNKRSEERLNNIDAELAALKTQNDSLKKAEEEGIADTKDNIAINEQLQAEAEARRAQEIRRQERREARLTFLKLIQSEIEAGTTNPIASATIKMLAASAQSFEKGVDRLGSTDKPVDNKGGMLNVNHPDEMIIQAQLNKKMGYPNRDDVVDGYMQWQKFKTGEIHAAHGQLMVQNNYQSNDELIKHVVSVEKAINNQAKYPTLTGQFNEQRKAFIEIVKSQNRTDIFETKVGSGGILGTD